MTPAALVGAFIEALKNDGGLVLLFLVVFVTGARKTWVWGWLLADERAKHATDLADLRAERDHWRRIALYERGDSAPEGDD